MNVIPAIRWCRALSVLLVLGLHLSAQAQDAPDQRVRQYLEAQRPALGLTEADLRDVLVTNSYTDAHNGVTHVYLRQRYQGHEVLGSEMGLHFDRTGHLLTQTGSFVPNLATAASATAASLTAEQANAAAARSVGLATAEMRSAGTAQPQAEEKTVPSKLVYVRQSDGRLKLAWDVTVLSPDPTKNWNVQVDAISGQVLSKHDLIVHERRAVPKKASAEQLLVRRPQAIAGGGEQRTAAGGGTYYVFPLPVESPSFGSRALVSDPANATASPYGWHDTNGVPGPEYTITRGNNVYAYEDRANKNKPGYSPDGTSTLTFNFPLDTARAPKLNQDANITNLFYWNNLVHDISYQYGFDEQSGNFQFKNYTGKGVDADEVNAEAQDGGGTDNANFRTLPDGYNPRMQMYLWPGSTAVALNITKPGSIAGQYNGLQGVLGRPVPQDAPFAGKLVLVNDGSATPTLGCAGPLVNATELKDAFAVIDRGTCTFAIKIRAAQAAGAAAVIMITTASQPVVRMGGDTTGIKIPSFMISYADGVKIKAQLAAGADVAGTIQGFPSLERDGDLDNGIIAHEYTHGISTRLTGGPTSNNCLPLNNGLPLDDPNYVCYDAMGEGWSDFMALWMTTQPGDKGDKARGIGTFVVRQPTTGAGIRRYPYSTNMTVDPTTYALMGNPYNETHDVGEVWCAMLWDLNWAMIDKYGYSADLYRGTGGNNKALQLVIDGLKLQPCKPGFVDGRDAILAADRADFGGANQALIWRVFARRGLGVSAVQGSSLSVFDDKAAFDQPGALPTTSAQVASIELYPNPARNTVTLRMFGQNQQKSLQISILTTMGRTVRTLNVPATQISQEGVALSLQGLAGGVYLVRVTGAQGQFTRKLVVQP